MVSTLTRALFGFYEIVNIIKCSRRLNQALCVSIYNVDKIKKS